MSTRPLPQQQPPQPVFDETAPNAIGANLVLDRGLVQFTGRRTLDIGETKINVPIPQLIELASTMLRLLIEPGEIGDAMRAIVSNTRTRIEPGNMPKKH